MTPEDHLKYEYIVDSTATFIEYTGKLAARVQYEKIRDMEPGKEREMYKKLYVNARRRSSTADEKDIWIEKFTVHDIARTMEPNFEAIYSKGDYDYVVKEIEGISTRSYMDNMQLFMSYLRPPKP